jgi:methylmalonyl-CoA mutase cobalamin-binding subunit
MHSKKMKHCVRVTVFLGVLIAVGFLAIRTPAQNNAQERAASLRAQLVEVQARQAELQTRFQQLEEDLKPENIERSLAGVGSVHPEELREARRRKLEIERKGVQSQLDVLAASRTRLETAIAAADAESYRQSAGPGANVTTAINNITASKQTRSARHPQKKRRLNKRR